MSCVCEPVMLARLNRLRCSALVGLLLIAACGAETGGSEGRPTSCEIARRVPCLLATRGEYFADLVVDEGKAPLEYAPEVCADGRAGFTWAVDAVSDFHASGSSTTSARATATVDGLEPAAEIRVTALLDGSMIAAAQEDPGLLELPPIVFETRCPG